MNRRRLLVLAGIAVLALGWFAFQWVRTRELRTPGVAADSTAAGVRSVRLYFAAPSGDSHRRS